MATRPTSRGSRQARVQSSRCGAEGWSGISEHPIQARRRPRRKELAEKLRPVLRLEVSGEAQEPEICEGEPCPDVATGPVADGTMIEASTCHACAGVRLGGVEACCQSAGVQVHGQMNPGHKVVDDELPSVVGTLPICKLGRKVPNVEANSPEVPILMLLQAGSESQAHKHGRERGKGEEREQSDVSAPGGEVRCRSDVPA